MKTDDITDFCTLKTINRLVVVTDDQHIRAAFVDRVISEELYDAQLRQVGILELVDHDVLIRFLQVVAQLRLVFNRLHDADDHVVKVVQPGCLHGARVLFVDFTDTGQLGGLGASFALKITELVLFEPAVAPRGDWFGRAVTRRRFVERALQAFGDELGQWREIRYFDRGRERANLLDTWR